MKIFVVLIFKFDVVISPSLRQEPGNNWKHNVDLSII